MKNASGIRRDFKILMLGLKRASSSKCVQAGTRHPGASIRDLFRSRSEGQALVEFAMVLPLIMLISWGIFIFCIACSNYIVLTEATGNGAQYIGVDRGTGTTNPCTDVYTAVSQAAATLTPTNITFTMVLKSSAGATLGTYTGKGTAFTCSGAASTSGTAASYLQQGGSAVITTSYPCSLTSFNLASSSCTLTAQTAEMVQ
jgi:Flp pilus assembly protein TadG